MKKTILALAAIVCLPLSINADTINLKFVMNSTTPAKTEAIVSQSSYAFVGTNQIVFNVLGKTCTYVGSAKAIGPVGCNYWLTVNVSTMTLSDPRAENNPGCTAPQDMLASCK